jgi:hypothetical protein
MAILVDIAQRLHEDFFRSGASSLSREQTMDLLELVKEIAMQVECAMQVEHASRGGGTS